MFQIWFMSLLTVCYHSCEPVNMHCMLHPWYISLTFSVHYAQGCILHHPFLPHRHKHCISSIKGKCIMSAQQMALVFRPKGWLIVYAKSTASYMCHIAVCLHCVVGPCVLLWVALFLLCGWNELSLITTDTAPPVHYVWRLTALFNG